MTQISTQDPGRHLDRNASAKLKKMVERDLLSLRYDVCDIRSDYMQSRQSDYIESSESNATNYNLNYYTLHKPVRPVNNSSLADYHNGFDHHNNITWQHASHYKALQRGARYRLA